MQGRATHDLHVEVTLAQRSPTRLTNRSESLGEDVVESFTVAKTLTEDLGLAAQFFVGELLEVLLNRVDLLGDDLQPFEHAAFAYTQQSVNDRNRHKTLQMKSTMMGPVLT